MPRNISAPVIAALQAPILNPAFFVQIGFGSTTSYLWSGIGDVVWSGQTWNGVGSLLAITAPEDSSTVEAKGITISLSGIDSTLLPEVVNDFVLGLPVVMYLALYDDTNTLIDSPVTAWSGRTDQPTIDVTGPDAVISLNCESRLLDMNVSVERRYTNEDLQRDNPGDLGFQFVNAIQNVTLFFGKAPAGKNNL